MKTNKRGSLQEVILSDEQQSQDQINQEQNPLFAQVEGKIIKLGGLDLALLQQENNKLAKQKRNILDGLINKIHIIESNVLDRKLEHQKNKQQKIPPKDQFHKNLLKIFNNLRHQKHIQSQNKRTQTFLVFQLDQYGRRIPTTVQKRIGKVTNKLIYTHFHQQFNQQFSRLLKLKQATNELNKKIPNLLPLDAQDNQEDIFGDDSPNKQNGQAPFVNIQIGKTLSFGLQQDIFSSVKRPNPIPTIDVQTVQNDKYFFMRKRVKINGEEQDGYNECYHQSGPSLEQLVDLKKQGIEYYGDLKQFKPKERKGPNIHKQYQMVQKIIERNNKK